jgi:hypothetical protein
VASLPSATPNPRQIDGSGAAVTNAIDSRRVVVCGDWQCPAATERRDVMFGFGSSLVGHAR